MRGYQARNGLEQLPFSNPSLSELQNNITYSNATVMKTLQSYQARNGLEQLPFSNPSLPELQNNVSYSNATVVKTLRGYQVRNGLEHLPFSTFFQPQLAATGSSCKGKIFLFGNRDFSYNHLRGRLKQRKTFIPPTAKHRRSRREIDTTSKSTVDLTVCANNTFTINYEKNYKVWNDFSITYNGIKLHYFLYRVTDNGLQVCTSKDLVIEEKWWQLMATEKQNLASEHCNVSVDGFHRNNYTLFKNFTVFFKPTKQSFTWKDYGLIGGYFAICSTKLSLSCNDHLVRVTYGSEYKVFKDFSLSYRMKHYDYREYRFRHDAFELCSSNDSRVQALWKIRNSWSKAKDQLYCQNTLKTINNAYHVVGKQFNVFWAGSAQYFKKLEYTVVNGQFFICEEKLKPETPNFTKEDMLLCNNSLIKIKFGDDYKVWNNFSMLYKKKVYDYTEYRVLNDSIDICNSTDNFVQDSWKLRNKWVKNSRYLFSCKRSEIVWMFQAKQFTVLKDISVRISLSKQVIPNGDYGVYEDKLEICEEKLTKDLYLLSINLIMIAPFCAVGLSIICLILLLVVYVMLPELRNLPGLNLMSLSFAFLIWLTYNVVFLLLYVRVCDVYKTPCDRLVIVSKFVVTSIFTNAAVNIYHLRKTFSRNTLVKSDQNKWKTFLKYCLFSWGIPVVSAVIYIVLVSKGVLRFHQSIAHGGSCVYGHDIPGWLAVMEVFGLSCCLLLYIIRTFIFTGYRIHQKLKASSNIVQKSNFIRKRRSFVVLLKLSTTTTISLIPLSVYHIPCSLNIKVGISTLAWLSGVYVGIAFVFTRKNYKLLKKKYFPAKKKPVNENAVGKINN